MTVFLIELNPSIVLRILNFGAKCSGIRAPGTYGVYRDLNHRDPSDAAPIENLGR